MKYKLASESCIIEFAFVEFIRYCQKFFQNDFTNLYLSVSLNLDFIASELESLNLPELHLFLH